MQYDTLNATQAVALIALFLVLLVPLAVTLAWWCKRRYARAVVRLQAATASSTIVPPVTPGTSVSPIAPLQVKVVTAERVPKLDADPAIAAQRLRQRVLGVQFAVGLTYWGSLLLLLFVGLPLYISLTTAPTTATDAPASMRFSAMVLFLLQMMLPAGLLILLPPPLLAYALLAGIRERVIWMATIASVLVVAAGSVSTEQGVIGVLVGAGFMVLLTLTVTAILRPSVRGAGPPLIASMTAGLLVFSIIVTIAIVLYDSRDNSASSWHGNLRELSILLVALTLPTWTAWHTLLRLARRYGEKRFSELQLALGTYWGVITLFTLFWLSANLLFSFDEIIRGAAGWFGIAVLLIWLAWRVLQRWGLRWAVRRAAPALLPLVLFRVFKPSQRSEEFMDLFLARWRFAAPVWLIGGPDLAGAFMEPDEFFAWLRRRLDQNFIRTSDNIHQHLDALDSARDPDGRFRVHELFCANDAWQSAALAMIERAGVIMLDLREYTENRAGTRFELYELLRRAPLTRVLLLTDEAADAPRLQAALQEAWTEVGYPVSGGKAQVQVLQVGNDNAAAIRGLVAAAARCAAGAGANAA